MIIIEGTTIEEAIQKAIATAKTEFCATKEEIEIKVVQEPTKKLFGRKKAIVHASLTQKAVEKREKEKELRKMVEDGAKRIAALDAAKKALDEYRDELIEASQHPHVPEEVSSKILSLSPRLKEENILIYKVAEDNNLIIADWTDLKAMCNYVLDEPKIMKEYCLNTNNINEIIRAIALAEAKGIKLNDSPQNNTEASLDSGYYEGITSGEDFERYCANLLTDNGYTNIKMTPGSGDHGVDILAEKDFITYAIQCKYYSSPVGNSAIQEAYSGKGIYKRDIAVVMTNSSFTNQAIDDANNLGVKLWDNTVLEEMRKKG